MGSGLNATDRVGIINRETNAMLVLVFLLDLLTVGKNTQYTEHSFKSWSVLKVE